MDRGVARQNVICRFAEGFVPQVPKRGGEVFASLTDFLRRHHGHQMEPDPQLAALFDIVAAVSFASACPKSET